MTVQALDATLFEKINGLAGGGGAADATMIFIAKYSPIVVAGVLVVLWLRWRRDTQRTSGLAAAAALIALGVGQVIGKMVPRARPADVLSAHLLLPRSLDTSFPSDHATLAFAVAAVVFAWNRKWGSAMLVFAFLTAFARVWTGLHYPGDVIGGAVLGAMTGSIVIALANTGAGERFVNGALDLLHRARLAAGKA
jgi:undecaprenyl-diphosphatase